MRAWSISLPLLLTVACHAGYLSPSGDPAPEGDADTDTDTDIDTGGPCDARDRELGDEEADTQELGLLATPFLICGELYGNINDGTIYIGDWDWYGFVAQHGGAWSLALSWEASASDLDLYLLDANGGALAGANSPGNGQPEQMDFMLEQGAHYSLVVVGWEGPSTAYELALE